MLAVNRKLLAVCRKFIVHSSRQSMRIFLCWFPEPQFLQKNGKGQETAADSLFAKQRLTNLACQENLTKRFPYQRIYSLKDWSPGEKSALRESDSHITGSEHGGACPVCWNEVTGCNDEHVSCWTTQTTTCPCECMKAPTLWSMMICFSMAL